MNELVESAPFFIVVSLPRCGSTAIYRALGAHAGIRCAFEPDFVTADWDADRVAARVQDLALDVSGIKHVWDPSGFPFVATHFSEVAGMSRNRQRVLALNQRVLASANRIVFLRRRDRLARVISDLLGQQTDLWGPLRPDGQTTNVLAEARQYRQTIRGRTLQPLDTEVIRWYFAHARAMEDALRAAVPDDTCLDVWYEDWFHDSVPLDERLTMYRGLLDFLGFPADPVYWDRTTVSAVLEPRAKLNDSDTLALIPNVRQIWEQFASCSGSDSSPREPHAAVRTQGERRHPPQSSPCGGLRFSIVTPTFQRRDLVLASVSAFARQDCPKRFEVIVVVDGSTDGTADALKRLDVPFPLTILEQPNEGASAARNGGAARARGEILLFLDDDMEPHPRLLAEHDQSHRDGADVVFGHLPLHPGSPSNFLSAGIKSWTDGRLERLTTRGAELTLHDLMTGQMSISRELFNRVGGFDQGFTAGGTFGDEDIDFGYRLMRDGYRLVFNPHAISWQNYVVRPHEYLRQWRQAGSADVAFARKHPEAAATIFALNGAEKKTNRYLWRPLVFLAPVTTPIMAGLRWLALAFVRRWSRYPAIVRFFYQVWAMGTWRGVRDGGGMPRPRPVCALAYHAIQDLRQAPVIGPYTVAPRRFARQLDMLRRLGFNFVTLDEMLCYARGDGGLPQRPLLLTFDDGYAHLLETMLPVLTARRIPGVVFAVSGQLGGTNVWDEAIGAPSLRLLDGDGLRQLAAGGVEIGAHSRTHRPLTKLSDQQLASEIAGSVNDLEEAGVRRPRAFAYPEGDHDERVVSAARDSGLDAAFTVVPGRLYVGDDPLRIPRVEVLAADGTLRLLGKVLGARRVRGARSRAHTARADAVATRPDEAQRPWSHDA